MSEFWQGFIVGMGATFVLSGIFIGTLIGKQLRLNAQSQQRHDVR